MALNEQYQSRYEEIQKKKEEISQREQEISQYESEAGKVASEKIPQRRFGSGVTKDVQQQYIERKKSAQETQTKLAEQKAQLQAQKQQVETYESEVRKAEAFEYGYKRGLEKEGYIRPTLSAEGQAGYDIGSEEASNLELRKQLFAQRNAQLEKFKAEGLKPVYSETGEIAGFEDVIKGMSIPIERVGIVASGSSTEKARFERAGVTFKETPTQTQQPEEKSKYEKIKEKLDIYTEKYYKPLAQATSFNVIGVGFGALSTQANLPINVKYRGAQQQFSQAYLQDIYRHPVKTGALFLAGGLIGAGTKLAGVGLAGISASYPTTATALSGIGKIGLVGVAGYGVYKTGEAVYKAPEGEKISVLGVTAKDITFIGLGSLAGSYSYNKISDYIRTYGMKEVPAEQIIAPEYLKGQKYPQIKKGETAGQLLQEFKKPISEIGETGSETRMFTASPQTFKGTNIAGAGSSELPGLYGAPRLSPTFLKASTESPKTFGLDVFQSSTPTALRTTTKINLIEGVSSSQKSLTPVSKALSFFKTKAEPGRAYVPFIKTEKEAVLTAGSEFNVFAKGYFFKFAGRRVPIFQATSGTGTGVDLSTFTSKAFSSYYASSGSVYNPASLSLLTYSSASSPVSAPSSVMPSYSASAPKSYVSIASVSSAPSIKISSSPPSSITSITRPSYVSKPSISKSITSYSQPKAPQSIKSIGSIKLPRPKPTKPTSLSQAFKTYVLKGGKKEYLPGIRAKGEALKFGEKEALTKLRATFGVEAVKGQQATGTKSYNVGKAFRGYKISKGKKVPLKDIFIQKTRKEGGLKGGRLASVFEKKAIQKARRIR